jgi:aspartyl-tRNA(Asn)/glutamyl-tRNA(Gln) amidotransferase subunit C
MLNREQVRKVAHLARLELTAEEEVEFTTQLGDILEYFEQLSELDVSGVPPMTRAIDVSNVVRSDELKPFLDWEEIIASAPDQNDDFFKVPQIINSAD